MKVLFDQNVPRPLARFLTRHVVLRAAEMGWDRTTNGRLLDAAQEAGFDVMVSGDKGIEYQQNMRDRSIAMVSLSAINWPVIELFVESIVKAVDEAKPGTFHQVQCGHFAPRRKGMNYGE